MSGYVGALLPIGSARRWVASGFYRQPLAFGAALIRSAYASWRLSGRISGLPVRVSPGQQLSIRCDKGARVELSGCLYAVPWGGARGISSITVGSQATFRLQGDFTIGHNVHLSVSSGGLLEIAGVRHSSGSGITCDARVMVASDVRIGADTIIAWGVFITDSDWHEVDGKTRRAPVAIGDHVWIAHDCSVLRGAVIPEGSVVAAKSIVSAEYHEPRVLLAGNPARIVRREVQWAR